MGQDRALSAGWKSGNDTVICAGSQPNFGRIQGEDRIARPVALRVLRRLDIDHHHAIGHAALAGIQAGYRVGGRRGRRLRVERGGSGCL